MKPKYTPIQEIHLPLLYSLLNLLKYMFTSLNHFKIVLIIHFPSLQLIVVVTIILLKEKEEIYALRSLATYSF